MTYRRRSSFTWGFGVTLGHLVARFVWIALIFAVIFGVVTCNDSVKHDPLKNLPKKGQRK